MAIDLKDFVKESKEVRELFYQDNHYCKKVEQHDFQTYLLDNPQNEQVLDDILMGSGITLMVSATGTAKTTSLIKRAKNITRYHPDYKIIMAMPSRALTKQVGHEEGLSVLVGGKKMDEGANLIAMVYEKIFDAADYIRIQKGLGNKDRYILIVDECHLLVSQNQFRKEAIQKMISCIEQEVFDNVILTSATVAPMTLFRCNQMVQFISKSVKPPFETIEIVEVDDVISYIKGIDFTKEFPFIRLNNKDYIEELTSALGMARLTSEDKKSKIYEDIIFHSRVNEVGISGIVTTNVLETGVSIKEYPANIIPIFALCDNNLSIDDMEQFLNRIRDNKKFKIPSARIVVRKLAPKDIKATLLDKHGKTLFPFEAIKLHGNDLVIKDVAQLNNLSDGKYTLKIEKGSVVDYRSFMISSSADASRNCYIKCASNNLIFENVGFYSFIDILRRNYNRLIRFQENVESYISALEQSQKIISTNMSSVWNIEEDALLLEGMVKGAISTMGELKDCISYDNKIFTIDKRLVYMISYRQHQRQYASNHKMLRMELEKRLGVPTSIMSENTSKEHCHYDKQNIWDGIKEYRGFLDEEGVYYAKCNEDRLLKQKRREYAQKHIRQQLIELFDELTKSGIEETMQYKILVHSNTKGKVTSFRKCCNLIMNNKMLQKNSSLELALLPPLGQDKRSRLQMTIFCYLKQRNQVTYSINDGLVSGIQEQFQRDYPYAKTQPSQRQIKTMLEQMYKPKWKGIIKNELRTDENDIFKLIKSDYEDSFKEKKENKNI